MPTEVQPARKSYFFEKGYVDLAGTIRDSWQMNVGSMTKFFLQARRHFENGSWALLAGVFWAFAAVCVVVAGSVFFFLASGIHIVILGFIYLAFFATFSALYLLERGVMLYNKAFVSCPHCHKKYDLPAYKCPKCGVKHSRLIPGPYGIFLRTCKCGKKLSTSFFSGRTKYQAFCHDNSCGQPIENAEAAPICIPVIGTPKAGKSCFLNSASSLILNKIGPANGWTVYPADEKTKFELAHFDHEAQNGHYPRKTEGTGATVFRIGIKIGISMPRILHIYDSAGEVFTGGAALDTHFYYDYSRGFVTIIDAAAIQTGASAADGLLHDPEDAFNRMLNSFERNCQIVKSQRLSRPLAVVLNKVDDEKVRSIFASTFGQGAEAVNEKCRAFLIAHGFGNLIGIFESRFKTVRFFLVSTLMRDGNKLKSDGVEEVLSWLLSNCDVGLKGTSSASVSLSPKKVGQHLD